MSRMRPLVLSAPLVALAALALVSTAAPAPAAAPPIGLGVVGSYAVLASSTVTNSGPSVVSGDLGVYAGTAVTGFDQPGGPGSVINGTIHKGDAVAGQAQNALTTAYNQAASSPSTADVTGTNVGNRVLQPGVYTDSSAMSMSGVLTLDGGGDPAAVFIFQAGSSLTVAGSSSVVFIGAAQACNVFWQVTSTATIGTNAAFAGTVMALADINVNTGATIQGRLLARTGQVTLLSNVITRPTCATVPTAPTATATPTTSPSASSTPGGPVTLTSGDGNGSGSGSGSGAGSGSGSGSGSGGSGSGSGGGADLPPTVPVGHPETGRAPQPGNDSRYWLLGAVACLAGAAGATVRGSRRRASVSSSGA